MRSIYLWSVMCVPMLSLMFVSVIHAEEVRSPTKVHHWRAPQVHSPASYRDEPWLICLLTEGQHLIYTAHIYTVQSRYGAWTVDWRRHRPVSRRES